MLALLVMVLLGTVVWLAGRHEAEQVQAMLDRDTADAVSDLRAGLLRNAQSLHALLQSGGGGDDAARRQSDGDALLRRRRELLRLEWRDASLRPVAALDSPFRRSLFAPGSRDESQPDVALACAAARSGGAAAYSPSHYVPLPDAAGIEVMEVCVPADGPPGEVSAGYLVASYSLRAVLTEMIGPVLTRGQEVALTEVDGTRLVAVGTARRAGSRIFTSQQLLDLPGATLMLRVEGWRAAPDLFPNLLTGLVTGSSVALVSVLVLLARDTRRRLRAERELADSLAFRKAMEDSVLTGLRARDLQGRITYVNPAFCEMVGFSAEELSDASAEVPYWPTELAHEYQQRQQVRLSGSLPPREGFESVFMRKDGTRFPVMIFEAPLLNAQRVQTGWMSAFIDISEQRRVEELSRASQERLQASARLATVGEMASLLSHELTQPLAAIASYASGSLNLLAQAQAQAQTRGPVSGTGPAPSAPQPIDAGELALAMRRIAEQADRAGQVIRSVHDFVRRRDRTREAVAPQLLLDAVLPLVRLQARKLAVLVQVDVEPDLPPVLCDRTLVEQVLLNLARNGMQAMDQPGWRERVLRLEVRPDHPEPPRAAGAAGIGREPRARLRFSVADLGCGIDDVVAARLFTPFFTTRADGMGLGLSLCRTVVEQHGGVLTHRPNEPRGTVFSFTLPVHSPDGDPRDRFATSDPERAACNP
ncbi:MAG: PAS domain S-box protein [Comamonadaceae bacterium]|nr:MAG: PAS domain S-box protein [Comamonadaceae bacterium]